MNFQGPVPPRTPSHRIGTGSRRPSSTPESKTCRHARSLPNRKPNGPASCRSRRVRGRGSSDLRSKNAASHAPENVRPYDGQVEMQEKAHHEGRSIALWRAIQDQLDASLPTWRRLIDHFGQVSAVERREAGAEWSDEEVFEALLRSVLSNSIDWARASRRPHLRDRFAGFDLGKFGNTPDNAIERDLVSWFKGLKAGSQTLRQGLIRLAAAARRLTEWSAKRSRKRSSGVTRGV